MISSFISADWSKNPKKRSIWVADIEARRLRKADPEPSGWDFKSVLGLAKTLRDAGPVLIGIDAALGLPSDYWRLAVEQSPPRRSDTFVDWLQRFAPEDDFFDTVTDPACWRVERPWFAVQKGAGGRTSFTSKGEDGLLRRIDKATGAKTLFAVSGIPGTVGSATRELWKELIPLLAGKREFAIWPFEGKLPALLDEHGIVLAETYPGLAYAAALADGLPAARMRIAKTRGAAREGACDRLTRAAWVGDHRVDLGDLDAARRNDDDFDACLTAASLLRCVCEQRELADLEWIDARAEGSMLLAGPVDPATPARRPREERKKQVNISGDGSGPRQYPCPIDGCDHVFKGGRGGWDAHVASPNTHPDWHPHITDQSERKWLFRHTYADWFDDLPPHVLYSDTEKTLYREGQGRKELDMALDARAWKWTRSRSLPSDARPVPSLKEALRLVHESGACRLVPVGIIGPREADAKERRLAEELGREIGLLGVPVLCGGRAGVMEAAAAGAKSAGALTVGILPDDEWSAANDYIDLPLATGLGPARNAVIARACEALVAVGGLHGTVTEVAYGLHFAKPVFGLAGAPQVEGVRHLDSVDEVVEELRPILLRFGRFA